MKYFNLISLAILLPLSVASAEVIHLKVETDQDAYAVGQTVHWTIYAWAEAGTNRGISLITLDLNDSANEALNPALMAGGDFQDTEFGAPQKFVLTQSGTPAASPPRLQSILTMQMPADRLLDVGNDGTPHVLCKGSYTATVVGSHTLNILDPNANYWPNAIDNADDFETIDITNAAFEVILEPAVCGDPGTVYLAADLNQNCYINLIDYHILASQFARDDCVAPAWCSRADINQDGLVDLIDLWRFSNQWLFCTDPANALCDPYW